MGRFIATSLLLIGAIGCHGRFTRCDTPIPCAESGANPCPSAQPPCPQQDVTVKGPPSKVIFECPPPTTVSAPQPGPSAAPQAGPPAAPQAGPPVMPQAGFGMPFAGPPMGGMVMPFAGAGGFGVNAQVKEKTRIGLVLDSIRIPIPWIRAVPVQRPAEITFQMPMQQTQGGFVQTAGFAGPVMPLGAMPFAGMPMSAAGGFGGVQMAPVPVQGVAYGTGYTVVPGPNVVTNAAGVQAGAQVGTQAGPLSPQDKARLEAAEKQVEELLKMCEELKKQKEAGKK